MEQIVHSNDLYFDIDKYIDLLDSIMCKTTLVGIEREKDTFYLITSNSKIDYSFKIKNSDEVTHSLITHVTLVEIKRQLELRRLSDDDYEDSVVLLSKRLKQHSEDNTTSCYYSYFDNERRYLKVIVDSSTFLFSLDYESYSEVQKLLVKFNAQYRKR